MAKGLKRTSRAPYKARYATYRLTDRRRKNKIARMERTLSRQPNNELLAKSLALVKDGKPGIKGTKRPVKTRPDGTTYRA